MTSGDADQPTRLGLTPRLLTAIPIGVLAVTGIVQWTSAPQRVVPVAESSARSSASPTTPAPAPAPAIEVTPAGTGSASVWTAPAAEPAAPAAATAATAWGDIPTAAQVAYQRATTVIDSADAECHLDWSLLAAIGKIESDHGRASGGGLDDNGLAAPAIVGPALTGADGTTLVADTDGGALDGDASYDHAVGPMQFLPATWTTVGVDADGDGQRNPQDLDDAALAAAVYLCAGTEDLATVEGQQAAVFGYNHSTAYVDRVLASATGYRSAFESGAGIVTTSYVSTREVAPVVDAAVDVAHATTARKEKRKSRGLAAAVVVKPAAAGSALTPIATTPVVPTEPTTPPEPTGPATPTDPSAPTDPSGPGAEPAPTPATAEELTDLARQAVAKAYPDATAAASTAAVDAVVEKLTGSTLAAAKEAVADLVAKLAETIEGLEPPATPGAGTDEGVDEPAPEAAAG